MSENREAEALWGYHEDSRVMGESAAIIRAVEHVLGTGVAAADLAEVVSAWKMARTESPLERLRAAVERARERAG